MCCLLNAGTSAARSQPLQLLSIVGHIHVCPDTLRGAHCHPGLQVVDYALTHSSVVLRQPAAPAEFALPYVTVAAMVEERPSAAAEVMLTAKAPLGLESSPDTSPDKPPGRSSKEYFSLPADASFGAKRLLLTSHPIPASLIDGSSDADSPTHSPMSDPERLRFSPFK